MYDDGQLCKNQDSNDESHSSSHSVSLTDQPSSYKCGTVGLAHIKASLTVTPTSHKPAKDSLSDACCWIAVRG